MFTGIIEELGTVRKLASLNNSARLTLEAVKVLEGTQIGDSIAVNGVCLTVTEIAQNHFSVDIMFETLRKTNLGDLKTGNKVNLERALQLQSRLGGHLVSGHVDGIGIITALREVGIAKFYNITASPDLVSYLIPKGSIAIDGISLTIVDVGEDNFSVSLIPHTQANTTLGLKGPGSKVNLETDLIGKYVAKFLNREKPTTQNKITYSFLAEHGFI
ncbi:MAG TPA: riboflavin synthase [Peptococcaceae bacterium]|nr:riboflavin synthase [Peptococcaceae bacterium]